MSVKAICFYSYLLQEYISHSPQDLERRLSPEATVHILKEVGLFAMGARTAGQIPTRDSWEDPLHLGSDTSRLDVDFEAVSRPKIEVKSRSHNEGRLLGSGLFKVGDPSRESA